ncbi:MAG: preprotein translocase subunit YajC [Bacteroidetes bacterium]|nr:preprotein translocase subunit YajC [Bacteroidota bacterium]
MMIQLLQAQGGSPMMSVILMVGMIAVMYFFMIRPQQKRAKEQKAFSASIGANEQIVTSSGIHGRINRINDDSSVQLEISRGVFITIERSAISMEMTQALRKRGVSESTAVTAS